MRAKKIFRKISERSRQGTTPSALAAYRAPLNDLWNVLSRVEPTVDVRPLPRTAERNGAVLRAS